jgi:hypothetical protein
MFATEPTLFIQAGSTFVIFLVTGVLVGALSLAQTAMARPASIGFVIAGWVAYDEMRSSFVVRGIGVGCRSSDSPFFSPTTLG